LPTNLNSIQRLDQLHSKGTSPELIDCLANDAQKLAELRSILRSQVCDARKFITNYCQLYYANQVPKDLELLIDEFELDINSHLEQLDQIVRDLLQIVSTAFASLHYIGSSHLLQEFAWASVTETRIATKLGQNMMLLTYVSIFYLPLAVCAVSALTLLNLHGMPNLGRSRRGAEL
jgi:hypothetical protein